MSTSLVALSLLLVGAPATAVLARTPAARQPADLAPVQATRLAARQIERPGYPPRARIWLDSNRDYYRRGERLRVLFSTTADAYVAVVHIDPDGDIEFLFPQSPWDNEYVRGGRTYSLPLRGTGAGMLVRSSAGVGYFYIIASPVPLDYRYFRGAGGYGWDWSYGGRVVHGDPFYALDELTRALLPPGGYVPYAVDYSTYYVGGIARYPSYACGGWSTGGRFGWGAGSYFGSCDRMDIFLRNNPYYFDSGRYRGDRQRYFRTYRAAEPAHGYKESPEAPRTAQPRRGTTAREPAAAPAPQQRPTLERRPPERPAERPAAQPPERQPARGVPRSAEPSRGAPAVGSSPAPRQDQGNRAPAAPATSRRARPGA